MAAKNTTPAARNFVRVIGSDEIASYAQKGSANRAAKTANDGSQVMSAEAFDAFLAAEVAAAESAAKAEQVAAEAAVIEEATEVVEAEVKQVKRDRLAPASKKLDREQKRVVAAWYRKVIEDALAAALVEDNDDEDADEEMYLPAATGATEADITAQVNQWLSYLPKADAGDLIEG